MQELFDGLGDGLGHEVVALEDVSDTLGHRSMNVTAETYRQRGQGPSTSAPGVRHLCDTAGNAAPGACLPATF